MSYKDILSAKFAHPVHAVHGPKTPDDQLKAFLWAVSHDLEDGLGEAQFDWSAQALIVLNPDDGKPITVPLADLAKLGFVPKDGQSAEEFVVENFESW